MRLYSLLIAISALLTSCGFVMDEAEHHYPVYEAIDSACAEIRLLKIKPGNFDDDLEIELEWAHLPDDPRYMALSYVWGHERSSQRCMVGGTGVTITKNLDDALRYFRKHYPSTMLWVDALCINQADLEERGLQVALMVYIYRLADSVFAWLGHPIDENKVRAGIDLMQSLKKLSDSRILVEGTRKLREDFDTTKSHWGQIDGAMNYIPKTEGSDLWYAWEGIAEIYSREYWTRLWIQQEATTPKRVRFWLGDLSFDDYPLTCIADWTATFTTHPRFPWEFKKYCIEQDGVGTVIASKTAREMEVDRPLIQLLQEMRNKRCADPLDRVFAPLGLACDVPKGLIDINYRANVVDLYTEAARVILFETPASLKVLSVVYTPQVDNSCSVLRFTPEPPVPSWVPDWRQAVCIGGFSSTACMRDSEVPLYHPYPGEVTAKVDGTCLSITGVVMRELDITILTETWDCRDKCWNEPLRWWHDLTTSGTCSPELEEAVRRCMVGDKYLAEYPSIDNGFLRIWKRDGILDWEVFDFERFDEHDEAARAELNEEHTTLIQVCHCRRMAILSESQPAVLPAAAKIGDKIAAFRGGHSLYLLRPLEGRPEFQFIGECFVHGWMDGEIDFDSTGKVETITLV